MKTIKLLKCRNHGVHFDTRLVFMAEVPGLSATDVALKSWEKQGAKIVMKEVPDALRAKLDGGALQNLAREVATKGRDAAAQAVRDLFARNSAATAEEAAKIGEQAIRNVAQAEFKVAEKAAEAAVQQGAKQVAAEAAKRAAARAVAQKVATEAVSREAIVVAEQVTARSAAMVVAEQATAVAAETTALETSAAVTGAGLGVTAVAILAAVGAVTLAGGNAYMLYKETDGLKNTEGAEEVSDRVAKDTAARYAKGMIDSEVVDGQVKRQGDLPREAEAAGSWLRGAAKLGRDTASDLMVHSRMYGEGSQGPREVGGKLFGQTDAEAKTDTMKIDTARLNNMVQYAEEMQARITDLSLKPEVTSATEKAEANSALEALRSAIAIARQTLKENKPADPNSTEYKTALEVKEKALVARDKVGISNTLDRMHAKSLSINGDPKTLGELKAKTEELQGRLTGAKTKADMQPIQEELAKLQPSYDKLVLADKNNLTPADANELITTFLRSKLSPADRGNRELILRAYGTIAAQLKFDISASANAENLAKMFPGTITAESLVNNGYFNAIRDKDGPFKYEGYVGEPRTQGYLVGLIERGKKLPGLESSLPAYNAELKKIIASPEWQAKADAAFNKGGADGAYAFAVSSLPTPEAYFHYEAKKDAAPAAAPKAVSGAPKAAVGGGARRTPGTAPKAAEEKAKEDGQKVAEEVVKRALKYAGNYSPDKEGAVALLKGSVAQVTSGVEENAKFGKLNGEYTVDGLKVTFKDGSLQDVKHENVRGNVGTAIVNRINNAKPKVPGSATT